MNSIYIFLIFLTLSCAKIGYITEQGLGQIALETRGNSNAQVLKNKNVDASHKDKIKKIEIYKSYFYKYFNRKETDIYDETTFLENEAVTYLVISSPKNKIEAVKTSFPIVGEFPYLGFFKKKSALEYKKEQEAKDLSTFMRPVYAYSTLDQWFFDDNILSSFFHYKDEQLAQLIFHELIHTVFFVKDEVDFNESLAQYIGQEMSFEFFNIIDGKRLEWEKSEIKNDLLMSEISNQSKTLNQKYKNSIDHDKTLEDFQNGSFIPAIKSLCKAERIKECWPLKSKWNNARFAAFGTYQKEQSLIGQIRKKYNFTIKDLLQHIEKLYQEFDDNDVDTLFSKFIKTKEQL